MTSPVFSRGAFYRACRMVHGYLSAFAFLALIFFAGTGLLLDHPDWLQGRAPRERVAVARLAPAELAQARRAADPDRALAAAAVRRLPLLGAYKYGSDEDGQALIGWRARGGPPTSPSTPPPARCAPPSSPRRRPTSWRSCTAGGRRAGRGAG